MISLLFFLGIINLSGQEYNFGYYSPKDSTFTFNFEESHILAKLIDEVDYLKDEVNAFYELDSLYLLSQEYKEVSEEYIKKQSELIQKHKETIKYQQEKIKYIEDLYRNCLTVDKSSEDTIGELKSKLRFEIFKRKVLGSTSVIAFITAIIEGVIIYQNSK